MTLGIVKLYNDYIHVGSNYVYQHLSEDVSSRTDDVRAVMLIETVLITVFSALFFFFVWLPYVKQKRIEVCHES